MSYHHNHSSPSRIDNDERAITKWLNTMEASLANASNHPFSLNDFSRAELQAISSYISSHEQYLGRYAQFLPNVQVTSGE